MIFMNTENTTTNELHKFVFNLSWRLALISLDKHVALQIPSIHIYINMIKNKLVFKIKGGYRLELQIPETIKLFGSAKKLIEKPKNGENEWV